MKTETLRDYFHQAATKNHPAQSTLSVNNEFDWGLEKIENAVNLPAATIDGPAVEFNADSPDDNFELTLDGCSDASERLRRIAKQKKAVSVYLQFPIVKDGVQGVVHHVEMDFGDGNATLFSMSNGEKAMVFGRVSKLGRICYRPNELMAN